MRVFDEQVFEDLSNKKIIIIGNQKSAKLIRELLLFKGYEMSMFIDLYAKGGFMRNARNILELKAVGKLGSRAAIFSTVKLSSEVISELESKGIHSADIYDMTKYSGGGIPEYLFQDALNFLKEQGGEWEHYRVLLKNGIGILEGGISKCDLIDDLLLIEGWILPQCNYDAVQVFVNEVFVGDAETGLIRNDIKKKFSVFNNEECGFCLESAVTTEETNVILIKANKDGEVVWEKECRTERVRIEEVIADLLQKGEYKRLLKLVPKYIEKIGHNIEIQETLNHYLNTSQDCYEKINVYQLIYQLGFFDASYMERYIEEIEKVNDIWTKMWLREQDIPRMLFYHPQLAVKSIYVWERKVMEQVAGQFRREKGELRSRENVFKEEKRVAIIVEGLADETAASSIFELEIANILAQKAYKVTLFVLDTSYYEDDLKAHSTVTRKRNSRINQEYHSRMTGEDVEIWYGMGNSLKERTWTAIEAIEAWEPEFIIDISASGITVAAVFQGNVPIIHISLGGYSSGAVFDAYIAKSKSLCMKENEIFNSIEESKISEAAINIPYCCKQRKIYYREDFGFKKDNFILVTVGNRLKYELDSAFVEVIKRALKKNPAYRWIIVGNDLGEDFYKAVHELIETGQIKVWGFENDLIALYEICDVYLNPNRAGGCGSMELAMMLKVPIALTDFPSDILPVIKKENCCGSDYEAISRYLEKLSTDSLFYEKESKKFYQLLQRKELSMEYYVDVILEAYEKRGGKADELNDKIERLIEDYAKMNRIRLLEERINEEFKKQQMRTPLHSCIGQEAVAVGICNQLSKQDTIYSNHRSHGHYIAKGGSMKALVAELYNRETGCSKGRGGSMHIIDRLCGIELTSSIVAGTVPLATGNALAYTLKNENNVSIVFLGDGASEEGCVYESICFAAVKKLPIVYVCENNLYAMYTNLEKREPVKHISDKFSNILPTYIVNGNDIEEVEEIAKEAIAYARSRKGPVFLECETYRFMNHYESASAKDFWYRDIDEWEAWIEKCPIKQIRQKIIEMNGNLGSRLDAVDTDIRKEIDEAFEFAMNSDYPAPQDLFVGMWA